SKIGIDKTKVELIGAPPLTTTFTRTLGNKFYEGVNHLGNVLAVVSDKKIPTDDDKDGQVDYYRANVISSTDYYPFGMIMPDRSFNAGKYRFGFGGGEKVNEIYGEGNYVDLGERGVDTRLGRLNWRTDTRESEYPWQSPYAYYGNSPIAQLDYNGEGDYYDKKGKHLGSDNKKDDLAYSADGTKQVEILGEDDKGTGKFNTEFLNANKLSVTHSEFQKQAATVYGESSVAYGIESKEEMFAIASVHQRNKIAFGANSDKAAEYSNTLINKQTSAMQLSNAAMINALTGGFDYSNGADQWDGAEQAMIPKANMDKASNGKFMYKMNTMGWSMSDNHYNSWKSAVDNKFGAGKFTVPQNKAAMHNYGGMTNKGKTRLSSTAQYGFTIFWKTK
ncbi:MAG: hypothetical protein V1781_06715, partial [Bacteroidota bacterium]